MAKTCATCRQWDYRGVLGAWTKERKVKIWLHLGACLQSENITQVFTDDWALHYPAGSSCKYWAESDESMPLPDEPLVCGRCGEPYWPPAPTHENCVDDAPMSVAVARAQSMGVTERD